MTQIRFGAAAVKSPVEQVTGPVARPCPGSWSGPLARGGSRSCPRSRITRSTVQSATGEPAAGADSAVIFRRPYSPSGQLPIAVKPPAGRDRSPTASVTVRAATMRAGCFQAR